ncbi:MAG: EMC3/TMCO1 family protein [Nanoarchaeota archaeon]
MGIENLLTANPKVSITVISFLVTFAMTLVTKKFTDQNRMKELKQIQKACQIKLKDVKGDIKKQTEINKEMMGCSMELMKHSFKPMMFTFIPLIFLFWWIRGIYTDILSGWIWWYIGVSIVSSIILRKTMDVV